MRILFLSRLLAFAALAVTTSLCADEAALVNQTVLVGQIDEDVVPTWAKYESSGNWAITAPGYKDVTVAVFDFGSTGTVSQATLHMPLERLIPHQGRADLQIYAYLADSAEVSLSDFSAGSRIPVAEIDAVEVSGGDAGATLTIDVTGVTNAILGEGQLIAFRVQSAVAPADLDDESFPAYRGAKFSSDFTLQYTPGQPPATVGTEAAFDGFNLSLPGLSAPGVGDFDVVLRIVDYDSLTFELASAIDRTVPGLTDGSALRGAQLLNCSAFSAPPGTQSMTPGSPVFSSLTGELSVPRFTYAGKQYTAQLQLVSAGDPMTFTLVSVEELTQTTDTAIAGSLTVEPSLDFIPLCHGWVLIGDTQQNALVERNVLTGATGNIYPFNTTPDQMELDAANQTVYLTTHPATERLYKLDMASGQFDHNPLRNSGLHFIPRWLATGENGNIFALLFDPYHETEAFPASAEAEEGLWMGLVNGDGEFQVDAIPLINPYRIDYDPVRDHVFLATESNLVSFTFNPSTLAIDFVPGTDVPVGEGCTDFSISPNGYRLAYSCPQGNDPNFPHTSLIDMNPLDYYDADGEFVLEGPPTSAIFSPDGETLIATDGAKLYFHNVFNHLLRDSYDMNLPAGETVQKIRMSLDGELILIFTQTQLGDTSGTIHWLSMPDY